MRMSILSMATYFSILAVPISLFIYAIASITASSYLYVPVEILLGISLLAFSISNFIEVFALKAGARGTLRTSDQEFDHTKGMHQHGASGKSTKTITFNVKRFNNKEKQLELHKYKVQVDKFTSVLTALLKIKSQSDSTLAIRCSCNMGICGSCGMEVNGKLSLACETNVLKNVQDGDEIDISPMTGHPMLKDLVCDFDDFFSKHISVDPYLDRKNKEEQYAAKEIYKQTKDGRDNFLPYSYCIMCGLCLDACPVVNTNPNFAGPQALSQGYRYYADSRDQMGINRLELTNAPEMVWGCEFAGSCSDACPKGVDPAGAIQMLKFEIMKSSIIGKVDKKD